MIRIGRGGPAMTLLVAGLALGARAQGGKEFIAWLQEYSPTGYFVIHDYETRDNKPGDHKQWLNGQTRPFPAVAVHECNHMRNGLGSANNKDTYFLGGTEDFPLTHSFTPFNTKEITADIPEALVNFQTDVYISGKSAPGDNMYSQIAGIYGVFEEYDAYITGLRSIVEMSACFKAHFNAKQDWSDLGNDATTSVWSNQEFRYFCLRYILCARAKHPDVYNKIIADAKLKEFYGRLIHYAEAVIADWIAVLEAQKMDTKTENGFDWHWKYVAELKKPEYVELEKILLGGSVGLATRVPIRIREGLSILPLGVDALGRTRYPAGGSRTGINATGWLR